MDNEKFKKIGEVLKEIGVCRATLKAWEQKGLIKSAKNHAGVRFYSLTEIEKLKDLIQPKYKEGFAWSKRYE